MGSCAVWMDRNGTDVAANGFLSLHSERNRVHAGEASMVGICTPGGGAKDAFE